MYMLLKMEQPRLYVSATLKVLQSYIRSEIMRETVYGLIPLGVTFYE
ncbi:MAG: hypothetical protein QW336_00960 [Candidatus Anstonellales archaeon]